MSEGKPFYTSKTFWFSLLTILVGIGTAFGFGEWAPDPEVQQLIEAVTFVLVGVINLVLRFVTSEPIHK